MSEVEWRPADIIAVILLSLNFNVYFQVCPSKKSSYMELAGWLVQESAKF